MKLTDFDFLLPPELIAEDPLPDRSAARLLYLDRQNDEKKHLRFFDLPSLLTANDVLVVNDSRVLPARIRCGRHEILLVELKEKSFDIQLWKCMVRGGRFFQPGREVSFTDGTVAAVQAILPEGWREISFASPDFLNFLRKHGEVPLPPYIRKKLHDPEQYQTVYAAAEGSVAAPTAGLHFTAALLERLRQQGTGVEYITLHVGPGTFLPVKTENISAHQMHSEVYEISAETAAHLNEAKRLGKKIIAVGSTSLRTLESAFSLEESVLLPGKNRTALFLSPPARFRFVDSLITNFHLPKSTLLMLVAAFLTPGENSGIEKVRILYQEAIAARYRFFSFGDAMFIR